jgi:MarR family transcriptional regulator, negative regulator of the multidrug operon emrRAB
MQHTYNFRMESALHNLVGALALALGDAQSEAAVAASGLPASAAAAIVAIGHTPGMTITDVARIAGVSHSVMVRIMEGLVARGVVGRAVAEDRRAVGVTLTVTGAALRRDILMARDRVIGRALAGVDGAALMPLVVQMLTTLTDSRRTADHLCRLCDEDICDNCPVEAQALRCAL